MKRCPEFSRVENDDTLAFCRADGAHLVRELTDGNWLAFDNWFNQLDCRRYWIPRLP